jgi:tetraacyldisaccharide 4'-kinase
LPKTTVKAWLERRWYAPPPAPLLLQPLAALYGAVAQARRARLAGTAQRLRVPVIVVGNLSVGGTGKTPFTIWLVERLREWGLHPGVISRGYGGRALVYPFRVAADSDPAQAGDEPVMMQRRLLCPLYVGPDRVAAARALLAEAQVDVIVADDGLQHYRLARDLELCVVDGARRFGNGALLPAGPLREPPARLREVDLAIVNGADWRPEGVAAIGMTLEPGAAQPLAGGAEKTLERFAGQTVHAVAGIGHPPRFFELLRQHGITVIAHPFADHHRYTAADLAFGADRLPVLMTEKDAVKCRPFAQPQHWVVPVQARIGEADAARVRKLVDSLRVNANG